MSVAPAPRNEQDARLELTQGITILERLGIIDFNGHFSVRLADGNILINTGSSVRSAMARVPAIRKKNSVAARYIIPMRLWSTVISHDMSPFLARR